MTCLDENRIGPACRHPHAQSICGELSPNDWHSLAVIVEPTGKRPIVDRWCPDCGSVRVWKSDDGLTEWRRPSKMVTP